MFSSKYNKFNVGKIEKKEFDADFDQTFFMDFHIVRVYNISVIL